MDTFQRSLPVIVVLGLLSGHPPELFAQNKSQPSKKNDEAEIRAAQEKLADAKREATAAQKEAQEAKDHVVKVRSELIAVRRKIEDAADGSNKLKQAHERVVQAKAKLEPIVTPILATVQQSPEYLALAKQRDQLRPQLATAVDRSVIAKQIAGAESALRKLETAAIERVPAAVKAREAVAAAEADLRTALAKADDALSKDPKFIAAKRELDKAENQAETAAAKALAKHKAIASAQNKVQAEIAEERKEDQRARQQQQNKNKNKKK